MFWYCFSHLRIVSLSLVVTLRSLLFSLSNDDAQSNFNETYQTNVPCSLSLTISLSLFLSTYYLFLNSRKNINKFDRVIHSFEVYKIFEILIENIFDTKAFQEKNIKKNSLCACVVSFVVHAFWCYPVWSSGRGEKGNGTCVLFYLGGRGITELAH